MHVAKEKQPGWLYKMEGSTDIDTLISMDLNVSHGVQYCGEIVRWQDEIIIPEASVKCMQASLAD